MSPRAAGARPTTGEIFGIRSLDRSGALVSTADAERLAAAHWGVTGAARELPAEVDQNFLVRGAAGSRLLKVIPADEPEELTDLVTAALLHVAGRLPSVVVQEVVPTRAGERLATFVDSAGRPRRARMTTFIEGEVVRSLPPDAALRHRLGGALAELAAALRDFDHPAAGRDLSWDVRHAGRMRAMLAELPPSPGRDELGACLDAFDAEVVPRLERLPVQVIHNDLSRDNAVLAADGRIGVIDFGDVVRTQRVNDLAVAMADHLGPGESAFAPSLEVLRGYLEVEPLLPDEVGVLYELVRIRTVMRIVGGEWRAGRFPENREYLARNVAPLRDVLARLPERPSAADAARLAAIATEIG
jgi:Ser/Thr protein kinase RdoA (MazF antagonist)